MRAGVSLILVVLAGCSLKPIRERSADENSINEARRIDAIEELIADGRFDEARRELDMAIADGMEHPHFFIIKGRLLMQADSKEAAAAAVPWFKRAIASSPSWFDPRFQLAQAYIRAEQLDSAAQVIDGIERLVPDHPAGPYGRGVIARMRGDSNAAADFFTEALRHNPDYTPALIQAMSLARKNGDRDLERRHLERLLALDGDNAGLHRRLGELNEAVGRMADAERAYRLSYDLQPDPKTARKLADVARQNGDHDAAERWLALSEGRQSTQSQDR